MKDSSTKTSVKALRKDELCLPFHEGSLENTLSQGISLEVDGTNVVRVPFGVRQPRKQRPERPNTWATLVLPFQPTGSPTPPPQAA
ncbi:hypothetical protein EV05_0355 [Prochlorococcus sp. MIT 0601]|nr:hypothetical protein EV05_0355 [Prochlorococcus sp. MIT 0601]